MTDASDPRSEPKPTPPPDRRSWQEPEVSDVPPLTELPRDEAGSRESGGSGGPGGGSTVMP
jgi:hypothetical protein